MPRTLRTPPPRVDPRGSNKISGAVTRGDSSGSRQFSTTQSQRGRSPAPGTVYPSPRATDRAYDQSAARLLMTDTRRLAAQRCLRHRPLPGRHQHLPLVLRLRTHPLTPTTDQDRSRHRPRRHRHCHLLERPLTRHLEVIRLLAQPAGGSHDQIVPPGQQLEQLDRRQRLRRRLGRSGGAVRRANSAARIGSSPATLANSARSNPSFLR